MPEAADSLIEAFRKTEAETLRKHAPEIERILERIKILDHFWQCIYKYAKSDSKFLDKYSKSLTLGCECEILRVSAYTLFLSLNALYRSAKENIRYMLESFLQSYHIDVNHPNSKLDTKWEILKEVENKRDYRSANLISSFKGLSFKEDLQREYKLLSQAVHPSHKQAKAIFSEVMIKAHIPTKIEKKEIQEISNSLLRLYDICYFLVLACFPQLKEAFIKNHDITEIIKKYDLRLLAVSLSKTPRRK